MQQMINRTSIFAVLLLCSCSTQQSFEVRGRVAGFSDTANRIIIAHEAIPGFMDAMTMPFTVKDPAPLDALDVGDAISFDLIVTQEAAWIENIESIPDSTIAVPDPSLLTPRRSAIQDVALFEVGDTIPETALVNQDGAPLTLPSFSEKGTLLTFIYTRCPLPDYCPRLSSHFQSLQQTWSRIHTAPLPVSLLSISFDENDQVEDMRAYGARYTSSFDAWDFAIGEARSIQVLANGFGVYYKQEGEQYIHNLTTALVSPEGEIIALWRGNDWDPSDVLTELELMVNP